uniref:Uncharacterized protein n=1 Tax=Fusarium oxysporum (strain Fo5176) TaxID=660025 RepID=A0A0D2YD50_FUSOF
MEQDGDLDALDRLKQGEGFPQELVEESASAVKQDALENQTVIAEFRSLLDEENALAVILDDLSKPKKGEGLHLKLVVVTRAAVIQCALGMQNQVGRLPPRRG